MRTTSERFTRLVAWRLAETMCTRWALLANAGAVAMFIWVAICMVLALTSDKDADYHSAIATTCLAVAAYFSGVVAKVMAGVASARQRQLGKNEVTMANAPFTDLCFALALSMTGTIAAPTTMHLLGDADAGVACSMLLGVVALCTAAIMPTAYRLPAPSTQL